LQRETDSYKVAVLGDKIPSETCEKIVIAVVVAEIPTEYFEYKSEPLPLEPYCSKYVYVDKGKKLKLAPRLSN
jgi:hypothetical protein